MSSRRREMCDFALSLLLMLRTNSISAQDGLYWVKCCLYSHHASSSFSALMGQMATSSILRLRGAPTPVVVVVVQRHVANPPTMHSESTSQLHDGCKTPPLLFYVLLTTRRRSVDRGAGAAAFCKSSRGKPRYEICP